MNHSSVAVQHVSDCFIRPKHVVEESNQPYHLGPLDLIMLSAHYIQKGLMFAKASHDSDFSMEKFLGTLKESLSHTLVAFYPLAGRFVTQVDEARRQCLVYIEPNKGPGVRFIHATLHLTMSDILSPTDVPAVVKSFFDHDRAVNYEGHTRPLLSVQVTELIDGIFIGVSLSHVVVDGIAVWNFWNTWSEIHTCIIAGKEVSISNPPVIRKHWIPEGYGPTFPLPYTHPDEFITPYEAPPLRERIFHFSSDSIARLKAKANEESNTNTHKISSFQALSAHVWRSIVRAHRITPNEVTNCRLAANHRHRMDPPLHPYYFGNAFHPMKTSTTVGELLGHDLGWAALMLNQSVEKFGDRSIREFVNVWVESPYVYQLGKLFDPNSVMMGSSPRFDLYGNEFGLGKPVAARSGYANKFVGKVTSYPGREGGGSMDLEICLPPESMGVLELDEEFMAAVSKNEYGC